MPGAEKLLVFVKSEYHFLGEGVVLEEKIIIEISLKIKIYSSI